MPEALARADYDFTVSDAPRRAKKKPKPQRRSLARAALGLFSRRFVRKLGLVVIAATLTGIVLNATMLQTARHPAPLFSSASAPDGTVAPAPAAPAPPPRPAAFAAPAASTPAAAPAPGLAKLAPAPAPAKPSPAPRPAAKSDPLGDLIRAEAPPAHRVATKPEHADAHEKGGSKKARPGKA